MSRRRAAACAWAWAWLLLAVAAVAAPDDDKAERARIAVDRHAVEARYEAARRDCEFRFADSACLDQAKQDRRVALQPLHRQIHLLDDARRRERAVDRLRLIQERQAAAAERPALPGPDAAASAASAAAPPPPMRRAVRPPPSASAAAGVAQQRQADQQQRLKDAQAHEDAVQARNARRDAQRAPAASLPVPPPGAPGP
ncbi:MAG: hypothetical protein QE285_01180 [Aquabacterium sp.]|nr:hypothetical protein [Aquabacterium sp.]